MGASPADKGLNQLVASLPLVTAPALSTEDSS